MERLVRKSSPNQLTYIGELLQGSEFSPKMVRKTCVKRQHQELNTLVKPRNYIIWVSLISLVKFLVILSYFQP